jgi:hypothetical protein
MLCSDMFGESPTHRHKLVGLHDTVGSVRPRRD